MAQYVADYCAPLVQILKEKGQSLNTVVSRAEDLFLARSGREKYHVFFHKKENSDFNTLMSHAICAYMQPVFKEFLDACNKSGMLSIADTDSFSKFVLYGQIAIINDDALSAAEKSQRIREYIQKLGQ